MLLVFLPLIARIITNVDEIYAYALKLLKGRDYTVAGLRAKLEGKFGSAPEAVISGLMQKNFLNDRRFAQNYTERRKDKGAPQLREELLGRGIAPELADEILSAAGWPSLREALAARMKDWKMHVPLQPRDAARLFRALARLGFDEDAIREEIETR
ncbi:MAG TPA: regulatory protein RecX [Terriglobia bacterium]